jgi:hypothetical protein
MNLMTKFLTTLAVGALAVAGVGVAAANEGPGDTLLNYGYDEENRVFAFNVSGLDFPFDCTLEGEELTLTYGEPGDDGIVPVDDLTRDDETVEFPNRPASEVGPEYDPADAPAEYTGSDGVCGLLAYHFANQVNHGQFMKALNSMLDMRGRGCVVRVIAQSDLGKGDQQVKSSEADDGFEMGDEGTIAFTSETVQCEHGNRGNNGNNGNGGPPADRGNSADAPGHNK